MESLARQSDNKAARRCLKWESAAYAIPSIASSPYFRAMYDIIGDPKKLDDESDSVDSLPCLALEWMDCTLAQVPSQHHLQNYILINAITHAVLSGLVTLGEEKLYIKPDNILLSDVNTDHPTVKIGDLGLTWAISQEAREAVLAKTKAAFEGGRLFKMVDMKRLAVLRVTYAACLVASKANLLHGDISTGNILLQEDEEAGFLIDLDLSVHMDRQKASGAPEKTGTWVFMAIGVLGGERHNIMHDLESVFWMLFRVCIHYSQPGVELHDVVPFKEWNLKRAVKLAGSKKNVIDDDRDFDETLEVSIHYTVLPGHDPTPGLAVETATPAAPAAKPTKASTKGKAAMDDGGRGEPAAPPPKRIGIAKAAEPTKAHGCARKTATPAAKVTKGTKALTKRKPEKTKITGLPFSQPSSSPSAPGTPRRFPSSAVGLVAAPPSSLPEPPALASAVGGSVSGAARPPAVRFERSGVTLFEERALRAEARDNANRFAMAFEKLREQAPRLRAMEKAAEELAD
ncbi:MAG: hypothetical protein M1826_001113 [Phylliscum demangeonii]|nr:MAG: hypothetical protein M1826_001113 [Phylliscum demangeonii]